MGDGERITNLNTKYCAVVKEIVFNDTKKYCTAMYEILDCIMYEKVLYMNKSNVICHKM